MRKYILFTILFLAVIVLSTVCIECQYMWSDEVFSFNAAQMILEKGQPLYDSGLYYGRAPLYHSLLALSMKFFGINEFGSRILNIPFLVGASITAGLLIYEALKSLKISKDLKLSLSFLTVLLYYISNFSISMIRETRMYTMSTFLFVFSIYILYKALVKPSKRGLIHIKWLDLKLNIYWSLAFVPIFYLAYSTQALSILLGLALVLFFTLNSILRKKYKQLLLVIGIVLTGLLLVYIQFNTLDLILVFNEISPWGNTLSPLYYSVLTVRNLPVVLLTAPFAIYFMFKKKNVFIIYSGSIVGTYLGFLSLQGAQQERYWQALIPLILIISVYVIVLVWKSAKERLVKILLILLILLSLLFHLYLSVKEYVEIEGYTPTSLSIHKKLEFNDVFTYLDENLQEQDLLIGDFHSAYTLYAKGYDVDYLVLQDDSTNWYWGEEDLYFDIPLLNQSELEELTSNSTGYLVVRDLDVFDNSNLKNIGSFERPQVYKF